MFERLVKHNIISCDGQYFCYLCICVKGTLEDILHHINGEEHMQQSEAKYDQVFQMVKYFNITKTYQEIINKTAYITVDYSFICALCQRNFQIFLDVLKHIEGAEHTKNLQNNIIKFDKINLIMAKKHAKNNLHKFIHKLKLDETNVFDMKLLLQNLIAYQECDSYINNEYNKYISSESYNGLYNNYYECIVNNKIIVYEHYTFNHIFSDKEKYTCNLCMCSMSSFIHILPHVIEERHRLLEDLSIKKYNCEMNNEKKELDSDTTKCNICSSISCKKDCLKLLKQKLLDNRVKILGLNMFLCTVCNHDIISLRRIHSHINGNFHKGNFAIENANLNTYKNGANINTSSNNTIDTDTSENHSSINDIYNVDHNTSQELKNTISLRNDINKNKKIFADIDKSDNDQFSINTLTVKLNKLLINNDQCDFKTEEISVQIINILNNKQKLELCNANEKSLKLSERLNEPYTQEYLKIEEKMYTVQEKLNNIKMNLGLIMPRNSTHFYCIACNSIVLKELYFVYEHLCSQQHKMEITQIKKDINCDKLSSQYMKKISEYEVKCYPCGNPVKNDISYFMSHIEEECHRKKCHEFTKVIDATFDSISQDVNNLWYSIQKFCCALCSERFDYKIEFVKHINKQHSPLLEDQVFDFCIPCTVLWLGKENCYTKHCNDQLHKYLLRSKDFMIEDLPDSIKKILIQVDELSNVLFQQSQDLSNDSVLQEIKQSLQNSLKSDYPNIKAFEFGSRVTGLASLDSDLDIYLDCGEYFKSMICQKYETFIKV